MFKKIKKSKKSDLSEYYEAERKAIISEAEAIKKLYGKKNNKKKMFSF